MSALKSVYVIKSESGPIKIGIAGNPQKRLHRLQQSQPFGMELAHVFTPANLNALMIESAAHYLLSEKRKRGEWFEVSIEEAINAIERAVKLVESGWDAGRRARTTPKPKLPKSPLADWMYRNHHTDRSLAAAVSISPTHISRLRLRQITPSLLVALKVNEYTNGEVKLHEMVPEHLLQPDSFRTRPAPTASKSPETA